MASQIYSRYIPPSKKPSTSNLPVAKPSTIATSPGSPAATPPTRQDASATYARYVPPAKTKAGGSPASAIVHSASVAPKRSLEEARDEPAPKRTKKDKYETKSRKLRTSAREAPEAEDERIMAGTPFASTRELSGPENVGSLGLAVNSQNEGENEPQTKKHKTKKESKRSERSHASELAKNEVDELDKQKSKKKKRVSEQAEEKDGAVETQGTDEDSRHKKLMQKRDKSMKKAEKFAQKSKSDSAAEVFQFQKEETPVEVRDLVPLPQPDPVPELPILSTSSSLPPWLAAPIRVSSTTTASFSELGIYDDVSKVLQNRGFNEAFAVQAAVLPLLLPGKSQQPGDILVSAATGSGKTLAYVLPMVEDISRSQIRRLRGLIIMPTRELVTQAKEVCDICASAFSASPGRKRVKIGTAVGNETLKVEQDLLMNQELLYDPVEYGKQQARLDKKWNASEDGSDEEVLCDEEVVSALPDHIFRPAWNVDILICTPGRLVEHIKSTPGFTLEYIKWLVVDEADKLLDQSFQQWLEVVMARLSGSSKSRDRLRKVILSATITRDIGLLNPLKLYRPKLVVLEGLALTDDGNIEVSQAHVLPSLLLESAVKVEDDNIKPLYLMELLKRESMLSEKPLDENPLDSSDDESSLDGEFSRISSHSVREGTPNPESDSSRGVLIFTKSNESAVRLGRLISLLSPSSSSQIGTLTSTTPRAARKSTLKSFAAGRTSILVASDLVSRGLDLPNLAHVINYDVPTSLTSYVHRIGRTARAGRGGHAWTLFTTTEGRWFWNEIGRTKAVERSSEKIERVNIKAEFFDEDQRARYEEALEELGMEARSHRPDVVAA
ncbi:P-loop containing nucleoside triphosphate hydrolase protein [Stipitochalara longipes BDJ]|nr:P-loop containing nucleoside triphosphate hydrolase protein [Stipitochalara longipes BDJ]